MRIVVDARNLTKEIGSGVGWYTKLLIESLATYTPHQTLAWYNSFREQAVQDILPVFTSPKVKVKITHLPNKALSSLWSSRLSAVFTLDQLLPKVDIFHAPSPYLTLPPAHRIRRVLTINDLTFLTHPEFHQQAEVCIQKHLAQSLEQADAIIAISESTRRDLLLFKPELDDKLKLVYPAARENFRQLLPEEVNKAALNKYQVRTPFLLYIGNIEPRKNLVSLIKAFERLRTLPNSKDLQLVLIGGVAWKSEEILKAIQQSTQRDFIRPLGYLKDEELLQFYNQARLFVYPSFYEGFGLPVLEAMQCGCPVVTSNTSSLPEVAGEAGLYVDPQSVDSIAERIQEFLSLDEKDYQALRKKALAQAKKFSWRKTAQETVGIYQKILTA